MTLRGPSRTITVEPIATPREAPVPPDVRKRRRGSPPGAPREEPPAPERGQRGPHEGETEAAPA